MKARFKQIDSDCYEVRVDDVFVGKVSRSKGNRWDFHHHGGHFLADGPSRTRAVVNALALEPNGAMVDFWADLHAARIAKACLS